MILAGMLLDRLGAVVLRLYGHALPSRRAIAGERLEAFLADSGGA